MTFRAHGWKLLLVGSLAAAGPLTATAAQASSSHAKSGLSGPAPKAALAGKAGSLPTVFHGPASMSRVSFHGASGFVHAGSKQGLGKTVQGSSKTGKSRYGYSQALAGSYGGERLQCVPFARAASGIELKGNAVNWWYAAAGVYERGVQPEAGSVLNFRGTGRMRLGHVAVVTGVLGARQIEIDHANWPGGSKGNVSRGIPVIDVSPDNDWSEVRVGLASGDYGSTYPTYGFIYDRPDTGSMGSGTMVASSGRNRSLSTAYVNTASYDEVAEAPAVRHVSSVRVHRPSAGTTSHRTARARTR